MSGLAQPKGAAIAPASHGTFLATKSAKIHAPSDIHGIIGPRPNFIQTMEKVIREISIYFQLFRYTYVVIDFFPHSFHLIHGIW